MQQHASIDAPSAWVARFAPLIPSGEALDLACGGGRHARLLAAQGRPVLALDRDVSLVARSAPPNVSVLQHDLERGASWPFEDRRFGGIVVTNYLHRPLFPHIVASLAPGGVLIYETFAQGNERFGKPSNPDFLLAPGELLTLLRPALRIIAFEDGYLEAPKPAMVQRVCAVKPEPGQSEAHLRLG
ncbi:MAG TPA: class I SAM-dependent methyltransferase [Paucimonas sp.]|nr:class I SAM-dependent methyltransferase [Paucimonas sp.]